MAHSFVRKTMKQAYSSWLYLSVLMKEPSYQTSPSHFQVESWILCYVCVSFTLKKIFELNAKIPRNQLTNIKPVIEGGMGRHANYLLDSFWFQGLNYTIIETPHTQNCVTSVAQNETDYVSTYVEYPAYEDYDKVNPFTTIADGQIAIVQAYNGTDPSTIKSDIFRTSISRLNWQVWLTLGFLLVCFAFLLKSRQRFLKRSLRPHWLKIRSTSRNEETLDAFFQVTSSFCQQACKEYQDSFLNVITFWVYVASFFFLTGYFCNVMSTDMIVVHKPDVIESYDELYEKGKVIPTFAEQTTDFVRFKDAINGSREFLFWKNLKKRYSEEDYLLRTQGQTDLGLIFNDMCTRRRVFVITELLQEAWRITMCKMKSNFGKPEILTYAPVDPLSQIFGKGLIVKKSDNLIIKKIIRKMRPPIEMGIGNHAIRETSKGILPEDMLPEDPPDMHDCMSDTLIIEDPDFQAASLKNFKSLVGLCLLLVFISNVCLFFEIVIKKIRRQEMKSSKQIKHIEYVPFASICIPCSAHSLLWTR